jgi:hypothetical protein
MQHSSLNVERRVLQLAPTIQSLPLRLPGGGPRQSIRCAAEDGLQMPKWPQQNFSRNLPCPQRLCSVSSKVTFALDSCAGNARARVISQTLLCVSQIPLFIEVF